MTPISLMCSWMSSDTEGNVTNLACSTGNALPCIRYVWFRFKQKTTSVLCGGKRPHRTFNKIFLITMQTCTEEKFCTLAIVASERRQLLQLITCSDGLTDTWYCRSVVLKVPLRGYFQSVKDFWEALEHSFQDETYSVLSRWTTSTFTKMTGSIIMFQNFIHSSSVFIAGMKQLSLKRGRSQVIMPWIIWTLCFLSLLKRMRLIFVWGTPSCKTKNKIGTMFKDSTNSSNNLSNQYSPSWIYHPYYTITL